MLYVEIVSEKISTPFVNRLGEDFHIHIHIHTTSFVNRAGDVSLKFYIVCFKINCNF